MPIEEMSEIHNIGKQTRELLVSREDCEALGTAGIILTGLSDSAVGFSFARHRPDVYQVLACHGGKGSVWVDGHWVQCHPGHVYLMPPGVFHAYRAFPRGRWQLAWIMFKLPVTASFLRPKLIEAETEGLAFTIRELHRESAGARSPILMRQLVDVLLFHRHRLIDPNAGDDRLLKLWSRVHATLKEPWDLDQLAAEAHMSPEHLRRLCHLHHQRSPLAFLRDMRMRRAATLLQRSSMSLEDVAQEIGYADAFTLSKAFKRFFHFNPSQQRLSYVGERTA